MYPTKQNRKRIVASVVAIMALALGIFGSAAISSLGQNGEISGVAYASDCEGPRPQPDLDGLCPPTPTPSPTPDEE